MRAKVVIALLVGIFVASLATAQESRYQLVTELHINPGKIAEFEAAVDARRARMTQANVTFTELVAASDDFGYTFLTVNLPNMAALDTRRAQFDAMPPGTPSDQERAREAIDHIDTSIRITRPDLSYVPADPRIPAGEAGFVHIIRLYVQQGATDEVGELLKQISALQRRHNVRDPRNVSAQVTGSDGPLMVIAFFAKDAADFYTQNQKNTEMMGQELQGLIAQVAAHCRRIEQANYTPRPDLAYQPSN